MTEWKIVHGSQETKPTEFDTTSSKVVVYQRRNVERVTNDEGGEVWEYEERTMTFEEYDKLRIKLLEDELTNTQLALTELYESLG